MKRVLLLLAFLALAVSASAQTVIFDDGFDPWINYGQVNWVNGPWYDAQNPNPWGHHLEGDQCYMHSGTNAMRAWVNYRVAYDMSRSLGMPYSENIYLRFWMHEDHDVPDSRPYDFPEFTPNGFVTLSNTDAFAPPVPAGEDWYRIGVRGRYASITRPYWADNLFIDTMSEGPKSLAQWPRRRGWRKYAIELYPYTGYAGDVKFFVDDTLVYSGYRDPDSYVDRVIMGTDIWTYENFWYDDFQLGHILPPVQCDTLASAKQYADGTWISLEGKVVSGRFTKRPFPGLATIQEPDRSSGLWVSTSKELDPGDEVTVRGRMATNVHGRRYLDAAEIVVTSYGNEPKPLAVEAKATAAGLDVEGLSATLWGRVTGRGQEPDGNRRVYLLLQTASGVDPIRVFWGNISDGGDPPLPVPNPADGDFVLVTGSLGRELVDSQQVTTLWVRHAGDLVVVVE